jgi:hypothetical protein
MWRRISGGLNSELQIAWWNEIRVHLAIRVPVKVPKNLARPKGSQPEGIEEMLRAAAAMEYILAAEKKWLGNLIATRVEEQRPAGGPWAWSLGRLGARAPLYGSAHNVIPPMEILPWIDLMIASEKLDGSTFALAQLSRRTGDRSRDIDDQTCDRVIGALTARAGGDAWVPLVREASDLKPAEEARAFGDSLPLGLQIARGGSAP